MRDWRRYVQDRIPDLHRGIREEVWTELSDHLEDVYVRSLAAGSDENEATQMALHSVSDWNLLEQGIREEKEAGMTTFGKRFILPSGVAMGLASLVLSFEIRFGPRPAVWAWGMAVLIVYKLLPISLMLTGGIAAWLSSHAGASRRCRALVAATPALYMLVAMSFVTAFILLGNITHWIPYQHLNWRALSIGIANWVALPAVCLLIGALPFLWHDERKQMDHA